MDIDAMPDRLAGRVRYALAQLRSRNGHHTFEDICRALSRIRITPNVLPATGPVSSGGDQGRDFESFRTWDAGRIAFVCTLQQDRLKEKIQKDIAAVMGGAPVEAVYAFCEAN